MQELLAGRGAGAGEGALQGWQVTPLNPFIGVPLGAGGADEAGESVSEEVAPSGQRGHLSEKTFKRPSLTRVMMGLTCLKQSTNQQWS